jgi:hypothetical protein
LVVGMGSRVLRIRRQLVQRPALDVDVHSWNAETFTRVAESGVAAHWFTVGASSNAMIGGSEL